jgi:uncharacterized protein
MKIAECQCLLTATLSLTRIPAPQETPLNKIAASVLEMARAYESDGIMFSESGDYVNSLACFSYGFGWLHFGLSSGLLIVTGAAVCPFAGPAEILPPRYRVRLEEKSVRYARLLDTARSSVECAPDPATRSHDFAGRILSIAEIYSCHGGQLLKSGAYEDALSCFSYGHGWLDAGVSAGLFRIMSDRDLFCV